MTAPARDACSAPSRTCRSARRPQSARSARRSSWRPTPTTRRSAAAARSRCSRQAQIPVRVVIVSDGAASHPDSRRYPPPALRALRRFESLAGLARLGVAPSQVTFLDLPDGAVPTASSAAGQVVVQRARALLRAWSDLRTVLVPWRRDPHDDHRATWSLMTAALDESRPSSGRLEYPIWTLVHPGPERSAAPRRGPPLAPGHQTGPGAEARGDPGPPVADHRPDRRRSDRLLPDRCRPGPLLPAVGAIHRGVGHDHVRR